ncbi:MAG: hypothetical protein Q9227_003719 [Pyrenula ochraceoflavens]
MGGWHSRVENWYTFQPWITQEIVYRCGYTEEVQNANEFDSVLRKPWVVEREWDAFVADEKSLILDGMVEALQWLAPSDIRTLKSCSNIPPLASAYEFVSMSAAIFTEDSEFSRSRWFTRGWTLQELIAPVNLVFFSTDWHPLGTKKELSSSISSIAGIEKTFLSGKNLELASVAKIMSWAALRRTSRVEDIAYCLLGIFDINMPLIYGEGKKAFRRLQEEIMRSRSGDHTLFAWGTIVETPSIKITDPGQLTGSKPVPSRSPYGDQRLLGLLAESPHDFASSGDFTPSTSAAQFVRAVHRKVSIPLAVDRGVRIELPLLPETFDSIFHWDQPEITQIRTAKIAVLFCSQKHERYWYVKLPLQPWGFQMYGRTREILFDSSITTRQEVELMDLSSMLSVAPERPVDLGHGDILIRRHLFGSLNSCAGWYTSHYGDRIYSDLRIPALFLHNGQHFGFYHHLEQLDSYCGFAIVLGRATRTKKLVIKLFPVNLEMSAPKETKKHGTTWHSLQNYLDKEPAYYHVVNVPFDSWLIEVEPFPRISITVEEKFCDFDDTCVDVVDLVIWPVSGAITSDGRELQ